jgi:hypothetical protein
MATALLAGINPLTGVYTMIVATPVGALFTSSEMMHVSTTSAIALAVGSSMIGVLERYNKTVRANQGKVMLAGISETLVTQLDNTGMLDKIGRENVFLAKKRFGEAGNQAYKAAQAWLAALEQAEEPEQEKK